MTKTHLTALLAALLAAGCSSTPTSPTPAPIIVVSPPVAVVPPVVMPPVVVAPTPNPLLSDPRFSMAFYRMFVAGALWERAPFIYIRTIDEHGTAVSPALIDQTAAAFINTTGQWSGGSFGVAGLERGTGTRQDTPGWMTVVWVSSMTGNQCGNWQTTRDNAHLITMNSGRADCTCGPLTAKHELGHAMGYLHTDGPNDIMAAVTAGSCDKPLSAREAFHARVAYSQPRPLF